VIGTLAVDRWVVTFGTARRGFGGYGRYGMPPPGSNDTGTAFCLPN